MNLDQETLGKLRRLIVFTVFVGILGANWRHVLSLLLYFLGLLEPFLLGFCFAFVLNLPMCALEKRMTRMKNAALKRGISLVLSYFLVLLILGVAALSVLPQTAASLLSLSEKLPPFIQSLADGLTLFFSDHPELLSAVGSLEIDWPSLMRKLQELVTGGVNGFLGGSIVWVRNLAGILTNIGIGLVFSVYLLYGKEKLLRQAAGVASALLPEAGYRKAGAVLQLSALRFSGFITGQCLEACILGLMFVVTLTLLRLPYAVLIGVLIAFTALIPVFGAFIGMVCGAFLMLIQSPSSALLFVLVFLVLQQIEGNLIYPHVVGGSVELPAVWVLVAVTLGGAMFGILGMLFFIPLFSVMYELLRRYVQARKREREAKGSQNASGGGVSEN